MKAISLEDRTGREETTFYLLTLTEKKKTITPEEARWKGIGIFDTFQKFNEELSTACTREDSIEEFDDWGKFAEIALLLSN